MLLMCTLHKKAWQLFSVSDKYRIRKMQSLPFCPNEYLSFKPGSFSWVILSRKHHKLCFQVKWFFMKIPKWSPFFRLFALKFELCNLKNPIIDAILYVFLGILMWSKVFEVKLPCGKDVAVVLMDTQGAFDSNR